MYLLTYDLNQQPLLPLTIKLVIENVLPRAKVKLAIGNCDHHFASHDLALHVRVCIVFAGTVVLVLAMGLFRCQFFQPNLVVMVQAGFIVVDEDASRYMHRRTEREAVLNAALLHQSLDFSLDGHDSPSCGYLHPYLFGQVLHCFLNRRSNTRPRPSNLDAQA